MAFDGLVNAMAVIAGVFIGTQILVECYEVVARYFIHRPPIWGVEYCEYTLFLLAFLGTTWVLKNNAHINVTIVVERLGPRARTYCYLFASFIGILISFIIFWFALKTTYENYATGVRVVKTLSIHKWPFLSFIALGYFLLFIQFIRQFSGHLKSLSGGKVKGQMS